MLTLIFGSAGSVFSGAIMDFGTGDHNTTFISPFACDCCYNNLCQLLETYLRKLWAHLDQVCASVHQMTMPWFIAGDFNIIEKVSEKKGAVQIRILWLCTTFKTLLCAPDYLMRVFWEIRLLGVTIGKGVFAFGNGLIEHFITLSSIPFSRRLRLLTFRG